MLHLFACIDDLFNFLLFILTFCSTFNDMPQRPRELQGYTSPIANDDGHLRAGFRRSKTGPLSTFVGTWDLPRRLPGIHPTSFYITGVARWHPAFTLRYVYSFIHHEGRQSNKI